MHSFFLPPAETAGPCLALTEGEAHHALHVLRIREGDEVAVLDGAGHEFFCQVGARGHQRVLLRVLRSRSASPPSCQVTLLQSLPKGKLIEDIIEKATELGAFRVVPLITERVVARFGPRESTLKAGKWQGIAVQALKQCGSLWLPRVEPALSLGEFLARREQFELSLLASLRSGSGHPQKAFDAFVQKRGRLPQSVCVWIGPEGDFAPAETELILATGAVPITLGPLVLRTETAAVYCLSIISYVLQFAAS